MRNILVTVTVFWSITILCVIFLKDEPVDTSKIETITATITSSECNNSRTNSGIIVHTNERGNNDKVYIPLQHECQEEDLFRPNSKIVYSKYEHINLGIIVNDIVYRSDKEMIDRISNSGSSITGIVTAVSITISLIFLIMLLIQKLRKKLNMTNID